MHSKKHISVRIDKKLYDKFDKNLTNTEIIVNALEQYYRSKEKNRKLKISDTEKTLYIEQIQMLKENNNYLKQQVEDWKKISIIKMGFLSRIKHRLTSKNEMVTHNNTF